MLHYSAAEEEDRRCSEEEVVVDRLGAAEELDRLEVEAVIHHHL